MASNATDKKGDSNPFRQSPLEGVVIKTWEKLIGNYGLGKQSERGQRLIEFCNENNMVIMNTQFQQPLCRLYT